MSNTYGWAPIVKREKQDDGTLLVTGRVSDDGLDRDAQRCDSSWLDTAVPQWFAEGGNVREMHGGIAAGKALEHWKSDDGGHMVTARVVDPGSIAKVEHEVLTGFSIGIKGGRVTKSADAPNGRIVGGQIIEVSLVDRPANPSCVLTVAKADEAGAAVEVEQHLVEQGEPAAPAPTTMRTLPGVATAEDVAETLRAELPKADEPEPVVDLSTDTAPAVTAAAQEVRAAAQGILDALSSLDLPTGWDETRKADEGSDIAGAQDAIAILARLIQSEASGLAAGDMGEARDISTLLEAVSALRWFIASEQAETVEGTDVFLADKPTTVKADTATEAAPADVPAYLTKADTDALTATLTAKFEGIVADALTKAEAVHKAEVASLRDELAKVKAQPTAGGPMRVRLPEDRIKADGLDRGSLLAQAEEYETKADQAMDRSLADGYRAVARNLREKADR